MTSWRTGRPTCASSAAGNARTPAPQLSLFEEADGWRYQLFATNTHTAARGRLGQLAFLEARHRAHARVEDAIRCAKNTGLALQITSGYRQVNLAWMWGALLAATIAGWLHQLTASAGPDGTLAGHGVRDGKAMIATLRHRLVRIPGRLVHHARRLTLRLLPGQYLLAEILARLRALPTPS